MSFGLTGQKKVKTFHCDVQPLDQYAAVRPSLNLHAVFSVDLFACFLEVKSVRCTVIQTIAVGYKHLPNAYSAGKPQQVYSIKGSY